MPFIYLILSIISWIELIIIFTLFAPIQAVLFILTVAFDKHRKILHYNSSLMCTLVITLSPLIRVKIIGRENIDRSKATVLVMNHQSMLDILFVFLLFLPAKMIAKKALAKVPVVGWTLAMNGHILIDRSNRKSQIEAIRRMDDILVDGDSLMIYPEGTRTKNGKIDEFKKGAFRSACGTGTSVLPVVISGAYEALPRNKMILDGYHRITLSVLPEIPVEKGSSTAELALKCHDLMSVELERLRVLKTESLKRKQA